MPPSVAQTAPAFAGAGAEATINLAIGANFALRMEYEDRRMLLPPLPPVAQDFHDELHGYKNFDVRALFQQLEDDWTRRILLPTAPSAFEDWAWNRDFSPVCAKPQDAEPIDFARPIVTLLAYDQNDWAQRFDEKRFWLDSDGLLGIPLVPFAEWLDENGATFGGNAGTLAAMVMLDEFVNAPSGSSGFGPAPRGRSARFGFSISAFR